MLQQKYRWPNRGTLRGLLACAMALLLAVGNVLPATAGSAAPEVFSDTAQYALAYEITQGRDVEDAPEGKALKNWRHLLTLTIKQAQESYVFWTPGPADGWPLNEVGDLKILGLPANTTWFLGQVGRYIQVDGEGGISLTERFYDDGDGGRFADMWPARKYTLTRVVPQYRVDGSGAGSGLPRVAAGEHPRVLFHSGSVPALNAKRALADDVGVKANMGFVSVDAEVRRLAQQEGDFAQNSVKEVPRTAIEASALLYALGDGVAYGQNAVQWAVAYANAYDMNADEDPGNPQRDYNKVARTLAMAYDWCYDLLDEADKTAIRDGILKILSYEGNETGWLEPRLGPISGHGGEEGLLYTYLMCGIALYDEYPALLDYVYDTMMTAYVPARNEMYRSGSNGQGTGYTITRWQNDVYSAYLLLAAGGENPYTPQQADVLRLLAVYNRRPDGQMFSTGDDYVSYSGGAQDFGGYWHNGRTVVWLAASLWQDGILQQEANRSWGADTNDAILQLLLRDHTVAPVSFDTLPQTAYFGGILPSMVARTGWNDNDDLPARANDDIAVVQMNFNEFYTSNHQHLDTGAFQIYYKGWLAIDSGSYASGNWNGWDYWHESMWGPTLAGHDYNYYKRGVAHNTMTVLDPDEETFAWTTPWQSNDGGIRAAGFMQEPATLEEMLDVDNGYKVAEVVGHDFGGGDAPELAPLYSYMAGDLSYAYTDKVAGYTRAMVFLNLGGDVPAALLVYDDITSAQADFKKSWLLHTVEEPQTDGLRTTVTKQSRTANDTTIDYAGKLVNDTLLPADAVIEKIGGPGKEFWVANATPRTIAQEGERSIMANGGDARGGYNYYGTNDALKSPPYGLTGGEAGGWRFEVSPGAPRQADRFLNVIQMMDSAQEPLTPALLTAENGMAGVRLADWDVYFGGQAACGEDVRIVLTSQTAHVLLTGLAAGTWYAAETEEGRVFSLTPGDGAAYTVTEEAGALYLAL